MPFDINFQKQIDDVYAGSACIQMLTQTAETQPNIYFRMLRVIQGIKIQDCLSKAKHTTVDEVIVGYREKLCVLIENTLNHYKTDSLVWGIQAENKLEKWPAIAILHKKRKQDPGLFHGHPVIIKDIVNDRVQVYDPANNDIVSISKMRLLPLVSFYFLLRQVDNQGNVLEI